MKSTFPLILFSLTCFGQEVSINSLSYYEGKKVTVCGVVVDSHKNKGKETNHIFKFWKAIPKPNFYGCYF